MHVGDPAARRKFQALLVRHQAVQRAHPDPPVARHAATGGGARMKLVTFGYDERVGVLDGDEISVLDVPTMRELFELGGADETGERVALAETELRAPIVPKKFFHTAGNFREHEEESKQVDWSHEIAPWIVFFQNVDAIIGPDEPVVYPGAPHRGARLRARACGRAAPSRIVVPAGRGDRVHRRLRDLQRHHGTRHPAPRDALWGLQLLQGDRDLLSARALDRDARRDSRSTRLSRWSCASTARYVRRRTRAGCP